MGSERQLEVVVWLHGTWWATVRSWAFNLTDTRNHCKVMPRGVMLWSASSSSGCWVQGPRLKLTNHFGDHFNIKSRLEISVVWTQELAVEVVKNVIKVLLYIKRWVKRMCSWMGLRSEQGCCFAQRWGGGWEGANHREYRVKGVIWNLQSRAFDVIKVRNQGIWLEPLIKWSCHYLRWRRVWEELSLMVIEGWSGGQLWQCLIPVAKEQSR